jgi:tetratricopeptide (TPR) repeat protein
MHKRAFPMFLVLLLANAVLSGCATTAQPSRYDPLDRESRLLGKFLSGRFAERAIDPGEAQRAYAEGLKDAPGNPILLEGALVAALSAGDTQGAVVIARAAHADREVTPLATLISAADALAKGKPKQALGLVQGFRGSVLDEASARLLSAWAFAALGEKEAALAAIAEADPRLRSAGLGGLLDDQAALLYSYFGNFAQAIEGFDLAGGSPLRLPGTSLRYAQAQSALGHADLALAILSGRNFHGSDGQILLAAQRLRAGEPLGPPLRPQEGAALGITAFAIAFSESYSSANYLPYVTIARIADPGNDELRLIAAEAHRQLGNEAATSGALAGISPTSPYARGADIQRAFLLQSQGDLDGAIALAQRAAQSEDRVALSTLAGLLRQGERWEMAKGVYDRLIAGAPAPDWTLFYLRGTALERLKRWPEAEADLYKALGLEPEQPDVLNYLGYSWVEQGINLEKALALLERAVQLQPEAGHILDSLGWANFRLRRLDKALELLEEAVTYLPGDVTVNDHLGDVYWAMGRRREAGFQWQRALIAAKDEEAQALRQKLKEKGIGQEARIGAAAPTVPANVASVAKP